MNLETKLLLFYLSLDKSEKNKFLALIGNENFEKIHSKHELIKSVREINDLMHKERLKQVSFTKEQTTFNADFDMAIMQVVRHIVSMSDSNVELAKSIEEIIGKPVSRPEKRSKYELQGMLLGALIEAPKQKLIDMRNKLMNRNLTNRFAQENKSNLDKWFSIILGNSNER